MLFDDYLNIESLEECIITKTDYTEGFNDNINYISIPTNRLSESILNKVKRATTLLKSSFVIPNNQNSDVYITSDIHADLEKIMYILYKAKIIDTYSKEDIYTFNVIADDFIIIIVGDIVDGKRNSDLEIEDPIGNIELLLHIFLFNLRLKARQNNSEVRFTIGNHDWHTVISQYKNDEFYNSYVHNSAKKYFINWEGRRNCLLPFYECCNYLIVSIGTEILCVHGGFHNQHGNKFLDNLIKLQSRIDSDYTFNIYSEPITNYMLDDNYGPLWTRFYSYGTENDVCYSVTDNIFKMIIVGHCPTDICSTTFNYMNQIHRQEEYSRLNCKKGGCVLVGCEDNEGPHLAFVDITMSRAFRKKDDRDPIELNRRGEILHLQHDDRLGDSRYYNHIMRKEVMKGDVNSITVWMNNKSVKLKGGRTNKKKKRIQRLRRTRKVLRNI
jgi:hypothetical protein